MPPARSCQRRRPTREALAEAVAGDREVVVDLVNLTYIPAKDSPSRTETLCEGACRPSDASPFAAPLPKTSGEDNFSYDAAP
jgi:hypothetical protein